jgi:hypothetical protein
MGWFKARNKAKYGIPNDLNDCEILIVQVYTHFYKYGRGLETHAQNSEGYVMGMEVKFHSFLTLNLHGGKRQVPLWRLRRLSPSFGWTEKGLLLVLALTLEDGIDRLSRNGNQLRDTPQNAKAST